MIRRVFRAAFFALCIVNAPIAYAVPPEINIPNSPLIINMGFTPTTASSSNLIKAVEDTSFIYQAGFNSVRWNGSLKKISVSLASDGSVQIGPVPQWEANDILSGTSKQSAVPAPAARKIYTVKTEADQSLATIEFQWESLSESQKTLLNASPLTGKADELGSKRLEYLRGERTLELGRSNGIFRTRDGVLGDIVNSSPIFVGAPATNVQGDGFQQFYDKVKGRTNAVYVGANDGMLHAFDVENGSELFAFVPNGVMRDLNWLAHPSYAHHPYVDGAIAAAEARVSGNWKTVLVAGMRGGAQGVFALDITSPQEFGRDRGAIWEFGDADDADMGNVLGAPLIAKLRTKLIDGKPEFKYFVMVGSGANNYRNDGSGRFDSAAPGVLFLLSLDKNPREKWKLNVNYFKFKTPLKESALANGLNSPAVAIGDNGAVKFAYAGDLQGNLWRFNFTGNLPWANAVGGETPLFTARDSEGNRQPISTQPSIVFAPGGGYVILFGTGKFIEESDTAATRFKTQSFYGIYDTTQRQYAVGGRGDLEPRQLEKSEETALRFAGKSYVFGSGINSRKGWYFDFLESAKTGERSITNSVASYGRIFFNSFIPCAAPCGSQGGRFYSLNALSGLPDDQSVSGTVSSSGALSLPLIFDMGNERVAVSAMGKSNSTRRYIVVNSGGPQSSPDADKNVVSNTNSGPAFRAAVPARRFNWREILNWQELRNAVTQK
ncbi:MAG: pilus assembly protein PilY [Burkholderiales bacterium]|nr:pilus assembly protein PilY [Burkholderiales bacterium]